MRWQFQFDDNSHHPQIYIIFLHSKAFFKFLAFLRYFPANIFVLDIFISRCSQPFALSFLNPNSLKTFLC